MSLGYYGRQRLTPEERARLREEARRRRAVARERRYMSSARSVLNDYLAYIHENGAVESALIARSAGEEISSLVDEIHRTQEKIEGVDRDSLEALQTTHKEVAAVLSRVRRCHTVIREDQERLRSLLDARIAAGMDKQWTSVSETKKQKKKEEREALLASIEERLSRLEGLSHLPEHSQREIRAARETARNLPTLGDFVKVTLEPLEKRCYAAAEYEADRRLRYELAREAYLTLCASVGRTPVAFPSPEEVEDPIAAIEEMVEEIYEQLARYEAVRAEYESVCAQFSLTPEEFPQNEEGIARMEAVCDDLYERIERYEMQEYVRHVTEKVLTEFGYRFYGSRDAARGEKRMTHMLFAGEDGSAVSMTSSADGRISIDFGGLDDSAREATPEERASIHEKNCAFCALRPEIVSTFAHYGVIVEDESVIEPVEEEAVIFGKDEVGEGRSDKAPFVSTADDEADRRRTGGQKPLHDTLD